MAELNLNTTVYQLTLTQSGDVVNLTLSSTSVTLELVTGGISEAYLAQKLTKENVSGLKITDSPEFASLQSTALQPETDGGQIPDADYSWFKGLFSSLQDKLVFSWIYGLVTLVKDAMTRIGLLEDKYILKYVVPADCTEIELTHDKYGNPFNFVEGDVIEISTSIVPFVGEGNNRLNLQVNGITSNNYLWATLLVNYFAFAGSAYYGHSGTIVLRLLGKGIVGTINSHIFFTETTYSNQTFQIETRDIDIESINSLELFASNSQYPIPAGTEILIKKL